MSIRMLLVACLTAVALADNYQFQVCTAGNVTGSKFDIENDKCTVITSTNTNFTLTGVTGLAENQTLTGVLNVFSDDVCTAPASMSTDVACTCGSNAYALVCDGAAFAVPSLLVLVASVMVYMMHGLHDVRLRS
eukprot:TRINITY_DN48_c0_g1_i13.p1 TRINITY_DN48_c0_g1~~TRINITY_DN48_c0_g1_i13.p1  ORF type:complete len:146 (+),score=44.72 TRINITY_DN48_c0_g1_i13:37-438(+)